MSKKIKYLVMVSNNQSRIDNAHSYLEQIPDLNFYYGDNEDVFQKFINCFDLSPEYDGLMLLEDDVKLCKNFKERAEQIIADNENMVVSFFDKACSRKPLTTKILSGSDFLWNQCNYYPREICDIIKDVDNVQAFKDYYPKTGQKWTYPSDTYIGYVLGKHSIKYLMKLPFLVQHLDIKSNFTGRSTKRQTKYFIDDYEDN